MRFAVLRLGDERGQAKAFLVLLRRIDIAPGPVRPVVPGHRGRPVHQDGAVVPRPVGEVPVLAATTDVALVETAEVLQQLTPAGGHRSQDEAEGAASGVEQVAVGGRAVAQPARFGELTTVARHADSSCRASRADRSGRADSSSSSCGSSRTCRTGRAGGAGPGDAGTGQRH